MVRMATHASPTSRNIIRSRPAARPDFLHVSWLGWLLIPAASVCMRRRQVETWSDLGRPPDPTFCMYLSPVDTSINWPPARPSVVVKPGTCIMRRQRPISAARPEPDFLHVSWLGWLLIPAASVCMRRRQVETWSDLGRLPDPTFCMYLSPVDTSINGPPARPSVHAKSARLAPPPDYGPAKQWVPYVFPMSCQLVTFVTFITAT